MNHSEADEEKKETGDDDKKNKDDDEAQQENEENENVTEEQMEYIPDDKVKEGKEIPNTNSKVKLVKYHTQ